MELIRGVRSKSGGIVRQAMDGGSACACHETRRHGLGLRQEAVKSDRSFGTAKPECLTCICIPIVLTSSSIYATAYHSLFAHNLTQREPWKYRR